MVTMFRGAVASLIYAKTLKLRAGVHDEAAALTCELCQSRVREKY